MEYDLGEIQLKTDSNGFARVGVERPDGLRSASWRIFNHGSDVYLLARRLGHVVKVSFHESGRCHVKVDGAVRHVWQRVRPCQPGQRLALFNIAIPNSEVTAPPGDGDEKVTWFPAAREGGYSQFHVVLLGPQARHELRLSGLLPIGSVLLPSREVVLLTLLHGEMSEENLRLLDGTRARMEDLLSAARVSTGDNLRGFLLAFKDDVLTVIDMSVTKPC